MHLQYSSSSGEGYIMKLSTLFTRPNSLKSIFGLLFCLLFTSTGLIANQISENQQKYIRKYAKQKHIIPAEKALLNTDKEPNFTEGFTKLYNGKDLNGWTIRGGTCTFEAKGESIVATTVPGSPNTYLSTNREDYTNFIFTAELKWEIDGNSGIMFRAKRKLGKNNEIIYGPQCEMEEIHNSRGWSGGIFGQNIGGWRYPLWLEAHSEVRKAIKDDCWNRVTILARGDTVKTWVNGIPAAHWVDSEYVKGFIALQSHAGRKGKVHFRNIQIKELTEPAK